MNIWLTSDSHFYHKNIINFARATRRGADVQSMNELLIKQWNSQVQPNDHVYHLGDFSFGSADKTLEILSRLNGRIHLIKGNHDHWLNKQTTALLESVQDYKTIRIGEHRAVLFHYPIIDYDRMHYGSLHFYGHVHGGYDHPGRAFDVGIDNRPDNKMALWHIDELLPIVLDKPIIPHHS